MSDAGKFSRAFAAAIKLKPQVRDDLATVLLNDVVILRYVGQGALGTLPGQPSEDDLYPYRVFYTEGLYHHIYNVMTTASVMLARSHDPPLDVKSLSHLRSKLRKQPSHGLERVLRPHKRTLDLLEWFADVRHKSIVHRAEAGYTDNTAIFDETHFAFCRIPISDVSSAELRKAAQYEKGMTTRFGPWNRRPHDAREAVTILDLGSHELIDLAPGNFDVCRRLVSEAACFDVIVSHPFMENVDTALATLIGTIPVPNEAAAV